MDMDTTRMASAKQLKLMRQQAQEYRILKKSHEDATEAFNILHGIVSDQFLTINTLLKNVDRLQKNLIAVKGKAKVELLPMLEVPLPVVTEEITLEETETSGEDTEVSQDIDSESDTQLNTEEDDAFTGRSTEAEKDVTDENIE